jgi:hypothetical protein
LESKGLTKYGLPDFAPQQFLDSLRKHNISEMGQFPEFLPTLYKEKTGK